MGKRSENRSFREFIFFGIFAVVLVGMVLYVQPPLGVGAVAVLIVLMTVIGYCAHTRTAFEGDYADRERRARFKMRGDDADRLK